MSNGKDLMIILIVGLIKKISLYKNELFSEPYINKNNIEVEL